MEQWIIYTEKNGIPEILKITKNVQSAKLVLSNLWKKTKHTMLQTEPLKQFEEVYGSVDAKKLQLMENINFEKFSEFINEGVYDKHIFKAYLLAGGPGSGKSYVAGQTTDGIGLKIVNSDIAYEYLMKKEGISLDIANLPPEEYEQAMKIRGKAKSISEKQFDLYLDGRLGLVIDGTGKDYSKIKTASNNLRNMGYDTYMIFVNTSLDVAQERNLHRDRVLKPEVVKDLWLQVQSNMGKFQNYFGTKNFILVDNNDADEHVFNKVRKKIMALLREPIENYKAKQWIQRELDLKRK